MKFFSDQLKIPALLFLKHPDFSFFLGVVGWREHWKIPTMSFLSQFHAPFPKKIFYIFFSLRL